MIVCRATAFAVLIWLKLPVASLACYGNYVGQGLLTTPNFYVSNYPWGTLSFNTNNLAQCQWTLIPAPNKLVTIFFDVFDLAPGAKLSIYRGTSTAADVAPIAEYTGNGPNGGVVQLAGVVTLVFKNVEQSFNKGFRLLFYSKAPATTRSKSGMPSPACGGAMVGAGTVVSPGHPAWYPLNSRCSWTLSSCESGAQLNVHFTFMNLEQDFDTVTLTSGLIQYGPYSGGTLPKDITASSPIVVTLSSDNVMSNSTGFALRFSTVSSAVAPVDPLADPNSCGALCPKSLQADPLSLCYAHDDPHMRRFDGQTYEFQTDGLFYLYKHKTSPTVVQVAFQACQSFVGAYCVCAVAIRYCDEVFVVERCATKVPQGGRSNKLYKAGSSSAMHITPRPLGGWTVSLPSGLTVEVGATREWIGVVDLHDSLRNKNGSEGLCGANYRCGTSPEQYATSYDSWRVPADESLFTVWKQAAPCKISKCANCSTLPIWPLPPGVLSLSDSNILIDQYSDSSNFLFGGNDTRRGKRDIGNNWTPSQAFYECYNQMQWTQAMQKCAQLLGHAVNLDEDIANCMRDIKLTGTTTYLVTAKEASKATCLRELNKAGVDLAPVLALMCPNDCSHNGTCINGVCSCFANRYGPDCSVDVAIPPDLSNTSAPVNCTTINTVLGVCLLQYVYGQTFHAHKPGSPTCKVTYHLVFGDIQSAVNGTVVVRSASYLSPSVVTCLLPPGKPGQRVRYAVSISNDGISYSNSIFTERLFKNEACYQTLYGSGMLLSPNYPSNYGNNAVCTWALVAATNMAVRLSFNTFNLENTFDRLDCDDGGFTVDSFTGPLTSAFEPRSYGSSLTCTFTSDATNTASGFNVTFTSVGPAVHCGGSVRGSATITSPGYPALYPSNVYCLWELIVTVGQVLQLDFDDIDLENHYDFLFIYSNGSLVASLTGAVAPPDYTLESTAYLMLRSDGSNEFRGFRALVTSTSKTQNHWYTENV